MHLVSSESGSFLDWQVGYIPSSPFRWFSPQPPVCSSHECANQHSIEHSRWILRRYRESIPSSVLSAHHTLFSLLDSAPSAPLREPTGPGLGYPSLHSSQKTLKAMGCDNERVHFTCLGLSGLSSLSYVQCLKNHRSIYFVLFFLVVSGETIHPIHDSTS